MRIQELHDYGTGCILGLPLSTHRVHKTGQSIANIPEFMNCTAGVVICLPHRNPARLTALDMQLNDALDNRTVTVAGMRVTPRGARRGEFHGESHGTLARIVATRALRHG